MRLLPQSITTIKDKRAQKPVTLVQIDLPAFQGLPAATLLLATRGSPQTPKHYQTESYSWHNMILEIGKLDAKPSANNGSLRGDTHFSMTVINSSSDLFDPPKPLSSIFTYNCVEKATVTVYQEFADEGLTEADLVPLFVGKITGPEEWNGQSCKFDVISLSHVLGKQTIGRVITLDDYPDAPEKSIGLVLPIPIGCVEKSPCIPIYNAWETLLEALLTPGQSSVKVADTSKFPGSGTVIINGDEIDYTAKTATEFTGASGIDQVHYRGAILSQKVSAYSFALANPDYALKAIAALYGKFNDRFHLIDASLYTLDLIHCIARFAERPFIYVNTDSRFLQAQFDEAGAGNTAEDPLNATYPNQPTATAKINQVNSLLTLKQTTVMGSLGEILSVKLFVSHYEDGLLPNDSLTVDIVGFGKVGDLSKPAAEDAAGDVAANVDIDHEHVEDLQFPVPAETPHTHVGSGGGDLFLANNQFVVSSSGPGSFMLDGGFATDQDRGLTDALTINWLAAPSGVDQTEYICTGQYGTNAGFTTIVRIYGSFANGAWIEVYMILGGVEYILRRFEFGGGGSITQTINNNSVIIPGQPLADTAEIRQRVYLPGATLRDWGIPEQQMRRRFYLLPSVTNQTETTGVQTQKSGEVSAHNENKSVNVAGGGGVTQGVNDYIDITDKINNDWSWFTDKAIQIKYNGSSDGVTSYIRHAAFEIEYVSQELQYINEITADIDGIKDDDSGTITGQADALIETPDQVFKWSILKLLGEDASLIDTTSFNNAALEFSQAITGGYKFAGLIDSKQEIRKLWQKLSKECRSVFYFDMGKAKIFFRPQSKINPVRFLDRSNIYHPDKKPPLLFKRTPIDQVANLIDLNYKRNWTEYNDYKGVIHNKDADSIERFGQRERTSEFNFDFVAEKTMAEHVCSFYLGEKKSILTWVEFEAFLGSMDVEAYDIIAISHDHIDPSGLYYNALVMGASRQFGLGSKRRPDLVKLAVILSPDAIGYILQPEPARAYCQTSVSSLEAITPPTEVTPESAKAYTKVSVESIILGSVTVQPDPATAYTRLSVQSVEVLTPYIVVTAQPATAFCKATVAEVFIPRHSWEGVGSTYPSLDTSDKKFGISSLKFDGSHYIESPDHADWQLGASSSGAFTFETYVKFNGAPGVPNFVFQYQGFTFGFSNNKLVASVENDGGQFFKWTPNTSTWYHIAWVSVNNIFNVYVGGTLLSKVFSDRPLVTPDSPNPLRIGQSFTGWMDEVRISDGARYTSNFSAPSQAFVADANTLSLLHFDGEEGSTKIIESATA